MTFRYSEKGPEGLLTGKQVYVFAARGGLYDGTAKDTQTGYVREFLCLLGMSDVEFVYAEGLNIGPESRAETLAKAHAAVERLVPAPEFAAA